MSSCELEAKNDVFQLKLYELWAHLQAYSYCYNIFIL